MSLRVLHPGLLTTVQDLGRSGHQREGIPVSGAMDPFALRVANLLVGNGDDAAALELTLTGPTITFERPALVALTGAELEATVDSQHVPMWRPIRVPGGATLTCGAVRRGCRAYLAVAGGIDVPPVLGSRSTYLRAGIGGHLGRALRRGDVLPCGEPSELAMRIATAFARDDRSLAIAPWGAGSTLRATYGGAPVVRLLPGAHAAALTPASRERLHGAEFRVAPQSDRMGYRLEGAPLELAEPLELLSEPVTFGTVQLPPGGNPIILMADRQTTGGYPRVGEVAAVDLPLLAQVKPGDRVRFRAISLDEAQALYLAREQELAQARQAIAIRHS